ncbi:MAG: divergent polysaccharide deacetylase family protein [Hyphomicrobiales bacterium]
MMGIAVVLVGVAIWLAQHRPTMKPRSAPDATSESAATAASDAADPTGLSATPIVVDSDWDRLRLRLESEWLRLFRAGDRAAILRLTSRTLRGALEDVGITRDRIDERPMAAVTAGAGKAPVSWRIQVPPRASLFRINDAVTQAMMVLGGHVLHGAERPGQRVGTALDLRVGYGDRVTHAIAVEPNTELADTDTRIAFIVTDLPRDSTAMVKAFLNSPIPCAIAIRADAPGAGRLARDARDARRPVFLELPMEPRGYPANDPGRGAILLDQSRIEIEDRITRALSALGPVSGVVSRYGSAAVNDRDVMRAVLGELRGRRLPFVDAHGAGPSLTEEIGEEIGARTITLGGVLEGGSASPATLRARIKSVTEAASQRGALVVAVRAGTPILSALEAARATWTQQGIEAVPATELIP